MHDKPMLLDSDFLSFFLSFFLFFFSSKKMF